MSRLTKPADDDGFEALLSEVHQCSRLCTAHSHNQRGALATQGSMKFRGKCYYCGKQGHRQADCKTRQYDEKNGKMKSQYRPPTPPRRPADAFFCESVAASEHAGAASSSHAAVLFDTCCTHHVVADRKYLTNFRPESEVQYMRRGGDEQHSVDGEGTAVPKGGPQGDILLQNALLVPTMIHNTVSSGLVATACYRVALERTNVRIVRPNDSTTILTGVVSEGMFQLSAHLKVQKYRQAPMQGIHQ
jgi:hypothetical protein